MHRFNKNTKGRSVVQWWYQKYAKKNVHTTFRKRAERLMYNIFTSCIANFFNLPSDNNKLKYLRKYCTAWKLHVYGIFLLCIFPHLDWMRRDTLYTLYLSIFTPNTGKYELEKFCIRTLSRSVTQRKMVTHTFTN